MLQGVGFRSACGEDWLILLFAPVAVPTGGAASGTAKCAGGGPLVMLLVVQHMRFLQDLSQKEGFVRKQLCNTSMMVKLTASKLQKLNVKNLKRKYINL